VFVEPSCGTVRNGNNGGVGTTVPNGVGGTRTICDPTAGYVFTESTGQNFGKITNKHGRRIVEFAFKFYF
jgi:hypothetical protein